MKLPSSNTLLAFLAIFVVHVKSSERASADAAIAFASHDGRWAYGSSWNKNNSQDAKATALAECRKRGLGSHCQIITSFASKCFALAVQDNSNGYGWQVNDNLDVAEQGALVNCQKYGKVCRIQASLCDKSSMRVVEKSVKKSFASIKVCDDEISQGVKFAFEQLIGNPSLQDTERQQIMDLLQTSLRCPLPSYRHNDRQHNLDTYQYVGDDRLLRIQIDRWVNWAQSGTTYEVIDKIKIAARYSDLDTVTIQMDRNDSTVRWVTLSCRKGANCSTETSELNEWRQ